MQKINCVINNCAHNNGGACFSNRVDIGGISAAENGDTCCGSFLDEKNYGKLTNNTNGSGECSCLVCKVDTCTYNNNDLCSLEIINVGGNEVNIYTETECNSFKLR